MTTRNTIDVEAFQTFLANAFAVQESGLDRLSLSALIEIQRSISIGEFDFDRAMWMIVDRALQAANASGVAIGLLETHKNELVYKAASGGAAQDVGRRFPAVLNSSSTKEMRREILRVENAESDKRIEAEICRQFGAKSLLMLPIYKEYALLGVMQVLFDEAHSFQDRELRAYRLMVGALEEGLSRSVQHDPKPQPANIVQAISIGIYPQQDLRSVRPSREASSLPEAAATQNIPDDLSRGNPKTFAEIGAKLVRDCPAVMAQGMNAVLIRLRIALGRLAVRPWSINFPTAAAAIGVVIALGISIWIFHQSGRREVKLGLPGSAPLKAIFNDKNPRPVSDAATKITAPNRGFRRVRIGPNEVDYVTDDVTIRTFETWHASPQLRSGATEVNFGDDVTVRYFAKTPAGKPSSSASETKPYKN